MRDANGQFETGYTANWKRGSNGKFEKIGEGYDISRWNRSHRGRYSYGKHRAKKRGVSWTLTFAHYEALLESQVCYYCRGTLAPTGVGLDRQDNRLGYDPNNVVPCCRSCNTTKGQLEALGFVWPRCVELLYEILARP